MKINIGNKLKSENEVIKDKLVDDNNIVLPKLSESLISDSTEDVEIIKEEKNSRCSIKLIIGLIPCFVVIFHAISFAIDGFSFLTNTYYGFDAAISAIIFDMVLFWPITLISFVLLISGLIDTFRNNK